MTYSWPITLDHGVTEYINTNVLRASITCPDGRYDVRLRAEESLGARRGWPNRGTTAGRPAYTQRQHDLMGDMILWEGIEPRTGMRLGNFPQAYTHVGLVNTAVTISELIEAREMRFRAWS